jgi:glycosyltransferase involved in cell wall biosynthesis
MAKAMLTLGRGRVIIPVPLTVLQIIPRLEAGGAELGALQVAERLVREGNRAVIASAGGRMVPQFEAVGARHVQLPVATKNPATMMANVGRIAALARETNADIIHARSRAPAWSALIAARRLGRRFVTTYHSDYAADGPIKRAYNSVMARGDAVIAVSQAIADSIVRQYPTAEPRVRVIHRGVDPERFDPAIDPHRVTALRRSWGIADEVPIALVAGRVTARKGHMAAVRAMRLAADRGVPPFALVCAGDDHQDKSGYRASLIAEAQELGVSKRLLLVGHVDDMPAAYAAASVTLNVSSAEGFARVALESQAMGVPVITADHGPGREAVLAPPDVTPDEATGFTVPFDDPERLADALSAFFATDEGTRAAMGRRGSERVRSTYTIERLTKSTLEVYRELLEPFPSPGNRLSSCRYRIFFT